MLKGSGEFAIGNEPEIVAGAGAILFAARGTLHEIVVSGTEPMVLLSIVAPNLDIPDEALEFD